MADTPPLAPVPIQTPFFEKDKAVFPPVIPSKPWIDLMTGFYQNINNLNNTPATEEFSPLNPDYIFTRGGC